MKRVLIFSVYILIALSAFTQAKKQTVGVYTSLFGTGSNLTVSSGDASMQVNRSFLTGAYYSRSLLKWLKINAGIEYADHLILYKGAPMPNQYITEGHIQFVSFPVYLQADLLKYFFFTFGVVIDRQVKNDLTRSMSGTGITGGTGCKYDFKNGITVFVHPFYELHSIRNWENNLITAGLRTGAALRF